MNVTRKILVLGGTGCTGRLIVADLLGHHGDYQVDVGARHPRRADELPPSVGRIAFDLRDKTAAARRTLQRYDLVILAVGPFEVLGSAAHRLCIEAGVDCLDVNDCLSAARAIFDLDAQAKEKGVRVLTGMGLSPGLTTLLLQDVLRDAPRGPHRLRSRLYVGSKQDTGRTATQAMVSSFTRGMPEIRGGAFVEVPSDDRSPENRYQFWGQKGSLRVYHYPTPEAWTLPRLQPALVRDVARMDYRVHFQGLPPALPRALRALPFLQKPIPAAALSHVMHAVHALLKNRKDAGLLAVAECVGPDGIVTAVAHAPSSYEATARFAGAMAHLALEGGLPVQRGVHSLETAVIDDGPLRSLLRRRSIQIGTHREMRHD